MRLRTSAITPRWIILVCVILVTVTAGIYLLGRSGAATPVVSAEVESGTRSGVTTITDSTASGGAAVRFATDTVTPPAGKFSIVVIPDTQYTLSSWPADFKTMTTWIRDNVARENTRFVIHVGDLVDMPDSTPMWTNGLAGMNLLDSTVPYVLAVGNHDMDAYPDSAGIRHTTQFNKYFPISKFQNWSWQSLVSNYGVGGTQGPSDNMAHKFSAGGTDYLVVTLKYRPSSAEMAWANQVITANPTRRIIIVTHEYLNGEGTRTMAGDNVWNTVAKKHKNVQFVLSGHITFASRRIDNGTNGNPVHQILSDYQTPGVREPNSYIRIMTFDPAAKTVSTRTFSPPFNKSMTTDRDQFTLSNIEFGPIK